MLSFLYVILIFHQLEISNSDSISDYNLGRVYQIEWGTASSPWASLLISSIAGDDATATTLGRTTIQSACPTITLGADEYINYVEKWYGTCYGCGGGYEGFSWTRAIRMTTNSGAVYTCDEGQGIANAASYTVYDYTNSGYLSGIKSAVWGDILDYIDFDFTDFTNCEDEAIVKHINWDKLQNDVDNSAEIPYSDFSINLDVSTIVLTFDIDLEYIGNS
eukprot:271868_1